METIVWTSIVIPIAIGILLALFENFIIQPLARKITQNQQNNNSSSQNNIKKNRFIDIVFKKIVSGLALLSPRIILIATLFFILGGLFTVLVANITNTNLANVGITDPEVIFSRMCGDSDTGIVGQVTYYGNGRKGIFITTSPPTSTVITDDEGYFYICNISVSEIGQTYTVIAKEESDYGASFLLNGSIDVTVFPNKKSIAIIRLH